MCLIQMSRCREKLIKIELNNKAQFGNLFIKAGVNKRSGYAFKGDVLLDSVALQR